jgi:hypothetical protein
MVSAWLLPPFLFTLFWSLFNLKKHKDLFIFSIITFGFFIPLSFAVSKVPNFIYATLPLITLLISGAVYRLWQNKHYRTMAMLALSVCLMYILLRFDLWFIKEYLQRIVTITQRLLILDVSVGALATAGILAMIGKKLWRPLALKILLILAVILVMWSSLRTLSVLAATPNPTAAAQWQVRQDAASLAKVAPADSAIIMDIPQLYRSNLYFEFWSSLPAVEVDPGRTINFWLQLLPQNRPVYLVSGVKITRIR